MVQPVIERLAETEHHRGGRRQAQPMRRAMHGEPFRRLELHRADAVADLIVQNLRAGSGNGIEARVLQAGNRLCDPDPGNLRQVRNFRRREAMAVHAVAPLDGAEQRFVILDGEFRVVTPLKEDARHAARDAVFDLAENFLAREQIPFGMPRRAVERAEGAVGVANVRVIDDALDGVGHHLVGMLAEARRRGRLAYGREGFPIKTSRLLASDSLWLHADL